jgi:hypothetical protein
LGVVKGDPETWLAGTYWTGFDSVRSLTSRIVNERLTAALDQLLGEHRWRYPTKWGGLLVSPPDPRPAAWTLTDRAWHWDPPIHGATLFSLFSNIAPRSGGTLLVEGSGRLLTEWYANLPPDRPRKLRSLRKQFLASHPFLRRLSGRDNVQNDPDDLLHGDSPLRVTEVTGEAGDVVVAHAGILHAKAVHSGDEPRFVGVEHIATG